LLLPEKEGLGNCETQRQAVVYKFYKQSAQALELLHEALAAL